MVLRVSARASGSTGKVVRGCATLPSSRDNCSISGGKDDEVIWMWRSPLKAMWDGGIDNSIPGMLPPATKTQ